MVLETLDLLQEGTSSAFSLCQEHITEAAEGRLRLGGALTIDNTVWLYYLCTDSGACLRTHMLGGGGGGGLGACSPRTFFTIRCSEIASEAIFVLKFIFGLDAARILGPSVVGAPLTMLHGSRSLVVTCRGYQCQMWALQSIGAKQQKFIAEVN